MKEGTKVAIVTKLQIQDKFYWVEEYALWQNIVEFEKYISKIFGE